MLRAACHLETPEGGGRRKGKVGAVHAGSRVGRVKGREEGTEEVALGSGGERPAGGWAGPLCGLAVDSEIRAGSWAGSVAAL